MIGRVLIVDDTEGIRFSFRKFLEEDGYDVDTAESYDEAMKQISGAQYDVVIADIVLGGRTGIDLLKTIRMERYNSEVIIITGAPEVSTAAEAVRLGAYDYLLKPVRKDSLLKIVKLAISRKRLADEKEALRMNLEAVFRSVGEGIIVVDNDLKITAINDMALGICAMTREVMGSDVSHMKKLCKGECINILIESRGSRTPAEALRVNCVNASGESKKVNISIAPLVSYDGKVIGSTMVMKDESRTSRLEDCSGRNAVGICNLVGNTSAMQKVCALAEDFARVDSTLLITGASGTGKGLLAQTVHAMSPRSKKPFVTVNCSALAENLLESELFGHVKGAFTGAIKDKPGRFEVADGGTLFLDEIGDITQPIQVKLLRALQDMEFERVGDNKTIKVNVRIIAATNKNLKDMVARGEFREDLYYRLKVLEIRMPSLSEHADDIPLLISKFIDEFNEKFNRNVYGMDDEAKSIVMAYSWPGNIRELQHVVEHAIAISKSSIIKASDLPDELSEPSSVKASNAPLDRHNIIEALNACRWNKTRAASMLGVSRGTLYNKLKDFGLED